MKGGEKLRGILTSVRIMSINKKNIKKKLNIYMYVVMYVCIKNIQILPQRGMHFSNRD